MIECFVWLRRKRLCAHPGTFTITLAGVSKSILPHRLGDGSNLEPCPRIRALRRPIPGCVVATVTRPKLGKSNCDAESRPRRGLGTDGPTTINMAATLPPSPPRLAGLQPTNLLGMSFAVLSSLLSVTGLLIQKYSARVEAGKPICRRWRFWCGFWLNTGSEAVLSMLALCAETASNPLPFSCFEP